MRNSWVSKSVIGVALLAGVVVSNCGLNPYGSGEGGYKIFAYLGKALQKPSAINDQQNSKDGSKGTIAAAKSAALRLAKAGADAAQSREWLKGRGITSNNDGSFTYWEEVANKPSEEDPDKLVTGRGEVNFLYTGTPDTASIDTSKIVAINSFSMVGRETKTWNEEIDTVRISIAFAFPDVKDFKPGIILAWAKNISGVQSLGDGDTASFTLDSLDDANHIQYGAGHFLDAHRGRNHEGLPYAFDFGLQVIHKNSEDPTKPYLRYQDNEGIINFALPFSRNNDSLYFTIHFYPDYYRTGKIRKGGPDGPVVVTFTFNEKSRVGEAIYYNENGKEIGRESL